MFIAWNILISVLWPVLYFHRQFRGSMRQRLGHFELGKYDPSRPELKVLINAVSAGEVNAITPFIHELRKSRPEAQVVLLTTTDSGLEMAQRKLADAVELVTFFPLVDLPWATRRFLDKLRPDMYITTESELWPNMESQCRQRGIKTVLVNGRMYLHNKAGLRLRLAQSLLSLLDLIICQDERQRENFLKLGVRKQQLAVSGNIKYDFELPEWSEEQLAKWKQHLGITDIGNAVLVAGSTHAGEEELVVESSLWLGYRVIVAPRHVERVEEVRSKLPKLAGKVMTLSEYEKTKEHWSVLIIDRYGVLVDFYRVADAVVMGGTFHPKVGGHNILEATVLGKMVIVGPYTYGIEAQVEMLASVDGVFQVTTHIPKVEKEVRGLDPGNLGEGLVIGIDFPDKADAMGERAREVTLANRGAAKRAADLVLQLVS